MLADAILLVPPSFYNGGLTQESRVRASRSMKKRTKMIEMANEVDVKIEPEEDVAWLDKAEQIADASDDERVASGLVGEHMSHEKYEKAMVDYVLTTECRRNFLDQYFNNPPRQSCVSSYVFVLCLISSDLTEPIGNCCDVCSDDAPAHRTIPWNPDDDIVVISSDSDWGSSAEIGPTSSKRQREHTSRTKEHTQWCKMALEHWRQSAWEQDPTLLFLPCEAIMSDAILQRLAKGLQFQSVASMEDIWPLAKVYGEGVLGVLHRIDQGEAASQAERLLVNELKKLDVKRVKEQRRETVTAERQHKKEAKQRERQREQEEARSRKELWRQLGSNGIDDHIIVFNVSEPLASTSSHISSYQHSKLCVFTRCYLVYISWISTIIWLS